MNAAFGMMLSLTIGFSQAMDHFVHMRHHSGIGDLPDQDGDTVDNLSIRRHGRNGEPENVGAPPRRDDMAGATAPDPEAERRDRRAKRSRAG